MLVLLIANVPVCMFVATLIIEQMQRRKRIAERQNSSKSRSRSSSPATKPASASKPSHSAALVPPPPITRKSWPQGATMTDGEDLLIARYGIGVD